MVWPAERDSNSIYSLTAGAAGAAAATVGSGSFAGDGQAGTSGKKETGSVDRGAESLDADEPGEPPASAGAGAGSAGAGGGASTVTQPRWMSYLRSAFVPPSATYSRAVVALL